MKLTINSKDLLDGIKQVGPAIKDNSLIPVMKNVLIEANKDIVRVIGTCEEITITHDIVCNSGVNGSFLLNYIDVRRILEAIEGECTVSVGEKVVEIISGDNTYSLGEPTDAKLFPSIPSKENGFTVDVNGEFFHSLSLASRNTYSMINNMVDICNVIIDFSAEEIKIFACDQISAFIKTIPSKAKERQIAILPELLKPLFKFQDSEIYVDQDWLHVSHNRTTVVVRLSEAKTIDVGKYKAFKKEPNYHIQPETLSKTLNKVLVYNDSFGNIIDLQFDNQVLKFSYNDPLLNKSATSSTYISGEDNKKIRLNGKNLQTKLSFFGQETDFLEVNVSSEKENMTLYSKEEDIITFIQPIN